MSLRETCHCGHDRVTHFVDRAIAPAEYITCLASGCACKRYVNANDPAPAKGLAPRPHHAPWCRCARCKEHPLPTATPDPETVETDPPPYPWCP